MNRFFEYADEMSHALSSLATNWSQAQQGWKDDNRNQFEREFIHEFNQAAKDYINQLRHMGDTVHQIRRETP